jgi:hypothetical protein
MIATDVTEYAEGYDVKVEERETRGMKRLVISATNEGGFNGTDVDLVQLIDWIKINMPELI